LVNKLLFFSLWKHGKKYLLDRKFRGKLMSAAIFMPMKFNGPSSWNGDNSHTYSYSWNGAIILSELGLRSCLFSCSRWKNKSGSWMNGEGESK
jgi:hypothetical protein